jgi:glucokinase
MHQIAIAIDLGGTKCAGAVINSEGQILESEKYLLGERKGEEVAGLIYDLSNNLYNKAGKKYSGVAGIGISVPGISYHHSGKVWAPNIPGWSEFPLKQYLQDRFADLLAILVDNDRACCILGESWLGAARGKKNAIFLTVGTGIGAGILVDGRILRGADDIAGAIGWLALESEYQEGYKEFGCFEYHASGDGLVREARDLLSTNPPPLTVLKKADLTASGILEAYQKKDEIAEKVIQKAVRLWGKTAANLVSLFNPEMIVFGGGIFGPAKLLIEDIRGEAARWAQPISIRKVKIVSSSLGNSAPLLGAAKMIFLHDEKI